MGRLLGAFVVCALVVAAPAHARPGQLDRSFSGDGKVEVSSIGPIAGDPDGGVTLVKRRQATGAPSAVQRLTPAGVPDPRFGTGGEAPIPSTLMTDVSAVAVDGRGRTVLSGFFYPDNVDQAQWHAAVIRLTADGRPDPGFAGGLGLRADAGTAIVSGAGSMVVRPPVDTTPSPGRVRLERLTSTGTVSWRLNLAHLVSDISSLVSDGHGGAYVSALAAPLATEWSCRDGAVLHVTSRGKVDRAFGRHGVSRLPVHFDSTMRGGVAPELATTRTRLYVKYGDEWCRGTDDRNGPYTLRQGIAALTRR